MSNFGVGKKFELIKKKMNFEIQTNTNYLSKRINVLIH